MKYRFNRVAVSVLACLALVAAPAALAETYYVAPPPLGVDGGAGTFGSPWATLQYAADQVGPGDTVLIRSGSYTGFQLTTSGTAAQRIEFRPYQDEAVSITADNAFTPDGINLEGASYVTIEGLTVNGRGRAGIRAVLCQHVTIRGTTCDLNNRWGVFTGFCDDLLIENNETSRSVVEHGIYVSNSGDRPVIRGNLIWSNNANGIHMNGDVSMGGDGIISDALVENNIIFDNGSAGGSGINMDGVQSSLVRNNLIYNTHASGISLYQIDGGAPSNGNQILNNTVLVASDGRWGLNIQSASTGNEVRNNVFYSAQSFRGAMSVCASCLTGFTSNNNAVEDRFTLDDGDTVLTLAQWRTQTGQDLSSFVATPAQLFENLAGDDYHLYPGSPAIDAGEARADVLKDLEGASRPLRSGWDIGCYEGGGVLFQDGFETSNTDRWSDSVP